MKKAILFLSLFSTGTSLTKPNKLPLREKLKLNLCENQKGYMNDQKYLKFIEPWIQKAEKELTLIAYCNKNDKSKLSRDYFDCVLQYNIALAKRHLKATSDNKLKLEESKKNLLEIITKVKASDKELNTLNIEKEHENTCQLFLNAGKEYAKNLSFWDLIF